MDSVPAELMMGCSAADQVAIADWWGGLDDAARAGVLSLLDPRWLSCSFALLQDESNQLTWHSLPVVVNSDLLEPTDEPDDDTEWEYLEYQLINPERFPIVMEEHRTFYIGGCRPAQYNASADRPLPAAKPRPSDRFQRSRRAVFDRFEIDGGSRVSRVVPRPA